MSTIYNFVINSGKVHITDPCYKADSDPCYNIPAKNGEWNCDVKCDGDRVSEFAAHHVDDIENLIYNMEINCSVDSGQLGIFDAENYVGDTDDDEREWYFNICRVTCPDWDGVKENRPSYGIIPDGTGFVSSSGYGDGCYSVYLAKDNNGDLMGFRVTFIDENDEDENDDMWDQISEWDQDDLD